jgi:hypothetical protein
MAIWFSRIEQSIVDFAFTRIITGRPVFYARDLENFVRSRHPDIAPTTPCRIMRQLRLKNHLGYKVLNRNESLYQMKWV